MIALNIGMYIAIAVLSVMCIAITRDFAHIAILLLAVAFSLIRLSELIDL